MKIVSDPYLGYKAMNTIKYLEKTFNEAKELIDYFIGNYKFQTGDKFISNILGKAGYLFRGQSNSQWPLLPSAFRQETDWSKFTPQPPHELYDTKRWLRDQLHAEAWATNVFLETADALGIITPIDYGITKRGINSIFDALPKAFNEGQKIDWDGVFPSVDYFRSMALAQHYGVPTRFLDWSESPLVACYFAAEQASCISNSSCSSLKSSTNQIAIYYFNVLPIREDWPIEIIKSPRHENSNLLSQKGLFVNLKHANSHFVKNREWPDLGKSYPELQIHTALLHADKSDELLRMLFDLGVTRYSLIPSLANAARAYEYKYKLFSRS